MFGYSSGCFGRARSCFNFARRRHLRQQLTARGLLSRNFCGAAVWCARGVSLKFANARWDRECDRARACGVRKTERQRDRVKEEGGARKTETKHDTTARKVYWNGVLCSSFWQEHLVPYVASVAGGGGGSLYAPQEVVRREGRRQKRKRQKRRGTGGQDRDTEVGEKERDRVTHRVHSSPTSPPSFVFLVIVAVPLGGRLWVVSRGEK